MQKKVKPVLLATNDNTSIFYHKLSGNLGYTKVELKVRNARISQHLYIVDEEATIKEGDWFFLKEGPFVGELRQFIKGNNFKADKVIASTDPSLGLPGISQSFLEQFVAVHGKGDVMMEMTKCFECTNKEKCIYVENDLCERLLHPKLDENGCVILSIKKYL